MRSCKRGEYPIHRLILDKPGCKHAGTTPKIKVPRDAADLVRRHTEHSPQEAALVIALSSSNDVLAVTEIGRGGLDFTPVDPRLAFGAVIAVGATAMVFCHNHPSGSLQPSDADEQLTRRLKDGAKLLNITFLDHVIVTDTGYFSFVEGGRF